MQKPTLCIIHNTIGKQSSIAKIAMYSLLHALEAGWQVTVVAHDLDASLQDKVEWLPLYVPPKAFLVQWLAARTTILRALNGRKFDVLHTYQPQMAALADVMHCQFLTRAAYERNCLEVRSGLKPFLTKVQQRGVLHAEDYYFRHWNPQTRMLYCSELVRQEFHRLYGTLPHEHIMVNACPPYQPPSDAMRQQARNSLIGAHDGPVLGYLGGVDERKGYRTLIKALEGDNNIFLLMGGPGSKGFEAPSLSGRFRSIGHTSDISTFFAACDAFIVPSVFDPCPLVVFEAASRGLPIIATEGAGNLSTLLHYDAGIEWNISQPLPSLVFEATAQRAKLNIGIESMAQNISEQRQGEKLLSIYEEIRREKQQDTVMPDTASVLR